MTEGRIFIISSYFLRLGKLTRNFVLYFHRDLAITLRERLGDWFRTVELMKVGTAASDSQLTTAWNNIGEFFMDSMKWYEI